MSHLTHNPRLALVLLGALLMLLLGALPSARAQQVASPAGEVTVIDMPSPVMLDLARKLLRVAQSEHPRLTEQDLLAHLRTDLRSGGPLALLAARELGSLDGLSRREVLLLCFAAGLIAGLMIT
ncbi:MAG: hypothetical protein KDC10_16350 [Calditrichaeota bacterium]|nr:hypothetical protein [Candidatus Cloacimonadota bacterium]MCA9786829.1 hypothetical protein [Candidatus Cloacimonadota bacterium]MCB1048763.1 hypothetical protein [Calditrichota bacterium]MCB9472354.1 hypothetical protein [Candidatus Delongbacteria bacterium]